MEISTNDGQLESEVVASDCSNPIKSETPDDPSTFSSKKHGFSKAIQMVRMKIGSIIAHLNEVMEVKKSMIIM